jgi:hypothetical protein
LAVQVLPHDRNIKLGTRGEMKLLAACEKILLIQKIPESQADASVYRR